MLKFSTRCLNVMRGAALVALLLPGLQAAAQQAEPIVPNPDAVRLPLMQVEKIATVKFSELHDDWEPVIRTVRAVHAPGVDARKDEFVRLKAEANRERDALGHGVPASAAKTSSTTAPTLGVNFFANTYDFSDPADNSLAVSANGDIVSAHNTRIHIYNSAGTQLQASSLAGFISGSGQPSNFTFDPKVSYDVEEDKFIVVFLNGASANGSRVIICFSETNDPTGNWNVYGINGNLNSLGVWTDFPQIGVNSEELFITGNLFTNAGQNQGAALWQVNKNDGYAGNSLTVQPHHLPGNFSVHPVEGQLNTYGPHMYFIESDFGSSNQIHLHKMTNTIGGGGVLQTPISFTMNTSYAIPPDAVQRNTGLILKTNDTRIQSSFYENNRIEFTLNTSQAGRASIFYGTGIISPFLLSFSVFDGQIVTFEDLHVAYGSVGYAGQNLDGVNKTYVAFNYSGANDFPGCGAIWADSSGLSPMLTVRTGVSFINSADNRWGDYADCQGRIGAAAGEAWMVGTFGNNAQNQRTYIGQLLPPQAVANDQPEMSATSMDVYPNPTTERVVFEFPVTEAGEYKVIIRNMQGQLLHTVVEDYLRMGTGRVAFNTTSLAAGTYLVSVENGSGVLYQDKLSVVR